MIPTGNFHLIRICSIFFKFHKNGDIQKLKAWSFRLLKNDFCRLYNERARALQSSITILLIHPVAIMENGLKCSTAKMSSHRNIVNVYET